VFSNLKYAVRSLLKAPWLCVVVVITLALGIAANTAVFSWTRGVLLHPLRGVADAQRIVSLETVYPTGEYTRGSSYPDFRDYRDSSRLYPEIFSMCWVSDRLLADFSGLKSRKRRRESIRSPS
jgi:hypothetical protein